MTHKGARHATSTAGYRAAILAVTPVLLLVAFGSHPYIAGRLQIGRAHV